MHLGFKINQNQHLFMFPEASENIFISSLILVESSNIEVSAGPQCRVADHEVMKLITNSSVPFTGCKYSFYCIGFRFI